jgi:predicted RNA-binding protein with PUA-like domain
MGKRWLLKSEPEVYPFAKLVQDGRTTWDGVRNPQARNNLAGMAVGDIVFFYHSHDKEVVGVAKVTKTAFPDPTADDPRWLAVELAAVEALPAPVSLDAIKADPALRTLQLVTHSRLSVMPVDAAQWARIEALSREAAKSGREPPAGASSRSSAGPRRSGRPAPRA